MQRTIWILITSFAARTIQVDGPGAAGVCVRLVTWPN